MKTVSPPVGKKNNKLIDIQAKLQAGKGKGYEQWATIYNLKEASKTLNFLTDNGVSDYEDLEVLARDNSWKHVCPSCLVYANSGHLRHLPKVEKQKNLP